MFEQGKIKNSIFIVYVLMIGIVSGAVLTLGVFVAPVIFVPVPVLGDGVLSHFQSGLLMSHIFVRFNYLLDFLALFIIFYEFKAFFSLDRDKFSFFVSILSVYCIGLFTLYYTPYILKAQTIGEKAIASSAFENMHKGSELDFKILLVSLAVLFVRRVYIRNSII
jgi:hypothetical protein